MSPQKKVKVTYTLTFTGTSPVYKGRVLIYEEIDNVIDTICAAAKAVQNIDVKCKKVTTERKKRS